MRARSGRFLIIDLSLALLALFAMSGFRQANANVASTEFSDTLGSTLVELDRKAFPFDPGVKVLPQSSSDDPAIVSYDTTLNMANAEAFYKTALESRGWISYGEGPLALGLIGYTMSFVTGPDTSIRYSASMVLSPQADGGTNIMLVLRLWPDPGKIPVYPGASNVVSKSDAEAGARDQQYEVSFIGAGTSQDITKYYSETLPLYGWKESMADSGNLLFSYRTGGPEAMNVSSVRVETIALSTGNVYVRITSTGFGLQ